jgi:hypothetical protein
LWDKQPETLSHTALNPVSHNGITYLLTYRKTGLQPSRTDIVQFEVACACRLSLTIHVLELTIFTDSVLFLHFFTLSRKKTRPKHFLRAGKTTQ